MKREREKEREGGRQRQREKKGKNKKIIVNNPRAQPFCQELLGLIQSSQQLYETAAIIIFIFFR